MGVAKYVKIKAVLKPLLDAMQFLEVWRLLEAGGNQVSVSRALAHGPFALGVFQFEKLRVSLGFGTYKQRVTVDVRERALAMLRDCSHSLRRQGALPPSGPGLDTLEAE